MNSQVTLNAVCYIHYRVPSELLAIIGKYFCEPLTDKTIRRALKMWYRSKKSKENCLLIYGHISDWNTSAVTDMSKLFYRDAFVNLPLNNWDVSNVTNMSKMFYEASSFNQPLDKWNVSNVTDMSFMFFEASSFNQPLENWNISNVAKMNHMFYHTSFEDNQPLEKWRAAWT